MALDFIRKEHYNTEDLIRIVALLRAPGGCPWDQAQTHASIKKNFIEETYEVIEAINRQSTAGLQEELGDVLFAAVKVGRFCGVDPEEALHGTCEKFIRRFRAMEEAAAREGRGLTELTLEELTALWNGAKERS